MHETEDLSASCKRYLCTIYTLSLRSTVVRNAAVAQSLHVSRASVSKAVARLKRDGLAACNPAGGIRLTVRGKEIAHASIENSRAIANFLMDALRMDEATAQRESQGLEYALSHTAIETIRRATSTKAANGCSQPRQTGFSKG